MVGVGAYERSEHADSLLLLLLVVEEVDERIHRHSRMEAAVDAVDRTDNAAAAAAVVGCVARAHLACCRCFCQLNQWEGRTVCVKVYCSVALICRDPLLLTTMLHHFGQTHALFAHQRTVVCASV